MITDYLYMNADSQPDKVFLVFEKTEYTYGDMAKMVSTFTEQLSKIGVTTGTHVAVLCGNRPAFLVTWFALNELGAVAIPLNVSLVGENLSYTLKQSEAKILVIEHELYDAKSADLTRSESFLQIEKVGPNVEKVPSRPTARYIRPNELSLNSTSSILYTSGTTGLPKGVVLPHQSYVSAGADMSRSLELTSEDRILVFLPLFHANPQMYAVTSALLTGCTLILLPKFSASRFFADVTQYRATGFTFVGTVLSILDKHYPDDQLDHGLRWCVGGGAPKRVWEAVESRFGVTVHELYGMTETGGWVTMNTRSGTRLGSVGLPRPSVNIKIRSPEGECLAIGEKGEITASSSVKGLFFTEYWKKPESTSETLKSGWLHTGDRGYLDHDGFLYFDGRVKELIRRGGEMIAPVEIEQQLLKHPSVKDCAVLGVTDDIMGEEIKAIIVLNCPVTPKELQEFLNERIAAYMIPRYFSFAEEIPKTETQKVKRHELAELAVETIDARSN